MNLYYMRDNHTFRALPLDVEQAVAAVREEFEDGYTSGMLCTKDIPHSPFGSSTEPRPHLSRPFNPEQVRAWMRYAISYRSPGDLEYESWTCGVQPSQAPSCWSCGDTGTVTTSSNGSGLIEAPCANCADGVEVSSGADATAAPCSRVMAADKSDPARPNGLSPSDGPAWDAGAVLSDDPRCKDCDLPNGCPEHCRCEPKAAVPEVEKSWPWPTDGEQKNG
jgi:hypothetical protein